MLLAENYFKTNEEVKKFKQEVRNIAHSEIGDTLKAMQVLESKMDTLHRDINKLESLQHTLGTFELAFKVKKLIDELTDELVKSESSFFKYKEEVRNHEYELEQELLQEIQDKRNEEEAKLKQAKIEALERELQAAQNN